TELLDYLQAALRRGWRPDARELRPLVQALPADLQAKAEVVLAERQTTEQQRARLAEFAPFLKGGDAGRGRQVFFGSKTACATCHAIGKEGGRIGPDLTKIGAVRSGPDLLEAILLPSASIAQGYESYQVIAKDGRTATGV